MTIEFSRRLAIVAGILAPLGETIRRWNTWQESPPNLFDDYIMGAFLLYGAWRTGKNVRSGQRFGVFGKTIRKSINFNVKMRLYLSILFNSLSVLLFLWFIFLIPN